MSTSLLMIKEAIILSSIFGQLLRTSMPISMLFSATAAKRGSGNVSRRVTVLSDDRLFVRTCVRTYVRLCVKFELLQFLS